MLNIEFILKFEEGFISKAGIILCYPADYEVVKEYKPYNDIHNEDPFR